MGFSNAALVQVLEPASVQVASTVVSVVLTVSVSTSSQSVQERVAVTVLLSAAHS